MISIISALAKNRVIGNKNKLPWHLPADFKWFKDKTLNKTIILGLNTFKSIGEKPLPNRRHIILTNDLTLKAPESCSLAYSIEEALSMIKPDEEVMICGGASVYKQFLPMADRMYLTFIDQDFEGDTWFPEFEMSDWNEITREDHQPDEKNLYSYSFVILEKKEP